MSSKSIVFNPSSMRRSQLKLFVVYGVLLLLTVAALIFMCTHLNIIPALLRILLLAFSCYEVFLLLLGVARFLRGETIKEAEVTDSEIIVNGNSYPLSEDGDIRLESCEKSSAVQQAIISRQRKTKTLTKPENTTFSSFFFLYNSVSVRHGFPLIMTGYSG